MTSLIPLSDALAEATARRSSVIGWQVEGWEEARGYATAARDREMPIVLGVSPLARTKRPLSVWSAMMRGIAEDVGAPVVAHLGELWTWAEVEEALEAGFTSLGLSIGNNDFDKYHGLVTEAVERGRETGASVEAEAPVTATQRLAGKMVSDLGLGLDLARIEGLTALAITLGDTDNMAPGKADPDLGLAADFARRCDLPFTVRAGSALSPADRTTLGRNHRVRRFDMVTRQQGVYGRHINVAVGRTHSMASRAELMDELEDQISGWAQGVVMEHWKF